MSIPVPQLDAQALRQRRDAAVVDIREPEERELIGSIPGAYPFPMDGLRTHPWHLMSVVSATQPVVLACMSGRRSAEVLELTRDVGFAQVYSLSGGVLGWSAAGLPLAGLGAPTEPAPDSLAALEQELISCFTAERIEVVLSTGDEQALQQSPRQTVRAMLRELRREHAAPAALEEAIHRLSLMAWMGGHPLQHIATNTDRMHGWLRQLAP